MAHRPQRPDFEADRLKSEADNRAGTTLERREAKPSSTPEEKQEMPKMPLTSVRLRQRFDAPRERVFDAWINPDMIQIWMLAPSNEDQILNIRVEPELGGSFSFLVRRQGQEIDHRGVYRVWAPPRSLAFSFEAVEEPRRTVEGPETDASVVTIELVPDGSATELSLTQDAVPEAYAERTRSGWLTILKTMAEQVRP